MRGSTKLIAYLGILIALAFIFSYIETLIPINLGIPGVKLGLANLVVIVALYLLGAKQALLLSFVRILLAAMTFGNGASLMYSLGGGLLSYGGMLLAKKSRIFSVTGVSILGGVSHNVGQILVAMLILETDALVLYLPVLMLAGMVSGTLIGILGAMIVKRLSGGTGLFGNLAHMERDYDDDVRGGNA